MNFSRLSALWRPILIVFLATAAANATVDTPRVFTRSELWCLSNLLDKDPLANVAEEFTPLFDLMTPELHTALAQHLRIDLHAGAAERIAIIRNFPITNITAAPGHGYLRNPKQLAGLKTYIAENAGGNFQHDPLLINLITDESGNVLSVDLWNAHHRLVAYLEAGYVTLGEIPEQNLHILLNGNTAEGYPWAHYLSIAGIDETKQFPHWPIPVEGEIRIGTVGVEGKYGNFHLGSRNSIAQLRKNMLNRKSPKIAVFFGTFDPPHLGHLNLIEKAVEMLKIDEAVIVANPSPVHKPDATPLLLRNEMLRRLTKDRPRINVYLGDAGVIVDHHGRDPFIERMVQTYGSHELYQVIGEDSFAKLVSENAISEKTNRRYIVFARPSLRAAGETEVFVPEHLKSIVTVLDAPDPQGISSSMLRRVISEGNQPDTTLLPLSIYDYAKEQNLYRLQ